KVYRLWLTLLIDAYSRCPLGWSLHHEDPNIMSIQDALHHAIFPKPERKMRFAKGQWIAYGIPLQLSLDNAWAHHSTSLEELSKQISCGGNFIHIKLDFRPPYLARYGALIER